MKRLISIFMAIAILAVITFTAVTADTAATDEMPAYVQKEADRVADKVLSQQRENTFSFLVTTDIHYSLDVSKTSMNRYISDLTYALSAVSTQIPLDFMAELGDKVWGATALPDEDTVEEFRIVNSHINTTFENYQNLQTVGNHDTHNNTVADRYEATCKYNDGAVVGDAENGYCYYDIENANTRVIVLNTSEMGDDLYSSAINISIAQRKWVAGVLEEMADRPDWHILFISHIPFDWGTSETGTTLLDIIKAYEIKTTVNVDGEEFDFSNGGADIIAQVHGHLHNFKVRKITGTDITRICVPNACFARTNEYSNTANYPSEGFQDKFGNEPTYAKALGTKDSTAFNVITVDPENGVIYAVNYGAGIDRVIDYASGISTTPTPMPTEDPNATEVPVVREIKTEDGVMYYYENGVKTYAGLIYWDGYYYYVNSQYKVVTGEYHVSKYNEYMQYAGKQTFDEQGRMIVSGPTASPSLTPTSEPSDWDYTINNMSMEKDMISVTFEGEGDGVLVVAVYDENGRLEGISFKELEPGMQQADFNVNSSNAQVISAFVWNSMTAMEPLSEDFNKEL